MRKNDSGLKNGQSTKKTTSINSQQRTPQRRRSMFDDRRRYDKQTFITEHGTKERRSASRGYDELWYLKVNYLDATLNHHKPATKKAKQ